MNKELKQMEIKRRKAANAMMKIYRRRQRNLHYALRIITILSVIGLILSMIMTVITIDPLYEGALNTKNFIACIFLLPLVAVFANDLDRLLQKNSRR